MTVILRKMKKINDLVKTGRDRNTPIFRESATQPQPKMAVSAVPILV
jgi:hypothetical protein